MSRAAAHRSVVLVVEDEFLIRMNAAQMIEAAGFAVVEAANSDEAIAILEVRLDITVVFTDIRDWPKRLAEELKETEEFSEEADTDAHDFVPADPLFSFDLLWISGWEVRLADVTAVAAELRLFSEEFAASRASQATPA